LIPLSVPSIKGNEWKYVKECLDTEWVSSAGKYVDLFEEKIAEYTGTKHAIACVNGTTALQIGLLVAGVEKDDEVIAPTLTFIATINAITYLGAKPVFMDADQYYNIDIEKTMQFIENETLFKGGSCWNKVTGRRIAAIIPVHVWGNAVQFDAFEHFCEGRNIVIVEDACESLGTVYTEGEYRGQHTGTVGRLGCLSFNGNKICTAGGGGVIMTDDESDAKRARYLTTQAKDDTLNFVHNEVGYNYRLTNIQAAIGAAQLEQLPRFLEKKKRTYDEYRRGIDRIPGLRIASVPAYARNNLWMVALQVQEEDYGQSRQELMDNLRAKGIETRPVWWLNHLQRPYMTCQSYKIEMATELQRRTISLPSSVSLSQEEMDSIIMALSA